MLLGGFFTKSGYIWPEFDSFYYSFCQIRTLKYLNLGVDYFFTVHGHHWLRRSHLGLVHVLSSVFNEQSRFCFVNGRGKESGYRHHGYDNGEYGEYLGPVLEKDGKQVSQAHFLIQLFPRTSPFHKYPLHSLNFT